MQRNGPDERGSTMVEAAVAAPLFFMLLFALISGAIFFKSYLTAGYVTKSAARAYADAGRDTLADYDALQAIAKGSAGFDGHSVQEILVFHAHSISDKPSQSCVAGTPSSAAGAECNIYSPADLSMSSDAFLTSSKPLNWVSTSRIDSQSALPNGPDFVGVTIVGRVWTPISALGQSNWTVQRTDVVQLEPRSP